MKTRVLNLLPGLALGLSAMCASGITITTDTFIGAGDTTFDNEDIAVQACTVTINGAHTFKSLSVDGISSKAGVVTHSAAPNGEANNRLLLSITGDASVGVFGRIDASGLGYVGTNLPGGAPRSWDDGGGGGHGGDGGWAYFGSVEPGGRGGHGSVIEPADFGGSGGGTTQEGSPDSPGGGAIKLNIGGTLSVNGAVLANGTSAWINDQGGAAGGSIWIIANRITGSGTISASGGNGEAYRDGGGGGGGRIALYYGTTDFSGNISAQGAAGAQRGGAGTIYRKANAESVGTVLLDNFGVWGASTPLVSPIAFNLTISNRAQAYPTAPLLLTSLLVATNGVLYHLPTQSLSLTVQGDAVIDLGGTINGNGRGYPIDTNGGPGQGMHANTSDGTAGGGGHGGTGGYGFEGALAAGGASYGDILQPTTLGSAGGYGDSGPELVPGGGAIRMIVGGILAVNGQLSVDGDTAFKNDQGGGAGGSLWLTVGGLSGTGTISANGGRGEAYTHGGGGAGGRIAIYFASNSFAGALTAQGNYGQQVGGAGTIYTKADAESKGHLALNNGDFSGAMTPLTSPENFHLVIERGAIAQPTTPLVLTTLTVNTNGAVYGAEAGTPLLINVLGNALLTTNATLGANCTLTVGGNLTVDAGGALNADAKGYATSASPGPGAGANMGNGSSGGGYGGPGGYSWVGGPNSATYGSMLEPVDMGSKGGDDNYGPGGNGGGKLRIQVGGVLTLNGRISADGQNWIANNTGGGAGGSAWITTHTFAGTGSVSANGGNGEAYVDGGGGGGGRVAVYYDTSSYTGAFTAYGGAGQQRGGAGTVYLKSSGSPAGDLIVNQGGNAGMSTPLDSPTNFNLIIGNQGYVYLTAPLTLTSLRLQPGGTLTHPASQGSVDITLSGDLTIETNANLTANSRGYPVGADRGPGVGSAGGYFAGGGAYGGNGGYGYNGEAGGIGGYGSITQPLAYGSAGGTSTSGGPGGAGGGAIKLTVGGTMTVDGTLSADGEVAPYNNAGGGAGGSIWASANALAGAGLISANGGNGEARDGGGGGGGRIALYLTQDNFTGALRASGGIGRQYGGAGTVYRKLTAQTYGTVLVDNLGSAGALTPLQTAQPYSLAVAGNAITYPQTGEPLTFSSLDLSTGGQLTHLNGQKLLVNVLQDAVVRTNGWINANGTGYPVAGDPGPGAGRNGGDTGSGGGYGGAGGTDWEGKPGGPTYGSAAAPTDWGSAGGDADGLGRTSGGGAIKLTVGGTLTVDGIVSANGGANWSWDQGNPSGGSLWLNAAALAGSGAITANGGPGGKWGGGGGGGRVAIYTPSQTFAGTLTASGGWGWNNGADGTVFFGDYSSNAIPAILASTPAGSVSHSVDAVEVTFNTAINATSFTSGDVVFTAPSGVLSAAQVAVTGITPQVFRISFPAQTAEGTYALQVGPAIANTFGTPMSAAFVGGFSIGLPRAAVAAAGTNGLAVTWPTEFGSWYRLQSSADLLTWSNLTAWAAGNGVAQQMTFTTTNAPLQFFRVQVSE